MNHKTHWAAFLSLALLCATALGASEESAKADKIALKDGSKDMNNRQVIQMGTNVVFKVNAYIDAFLGKTIINANAELSNHTDETQYLIYCITFYDINKKIVGAYAANCTLAPKKNTQFGSALIDGKLEDFQRVAYYRLYTCSFTTVPKNPF